MAHDIFISYAAQDKPTADAVCAKLEAERLRCWIAPRDVLPGVSYAEALVDAISESSLMVLVFSSRSNNSPQVMREVERAASKGIPILPFRIEDVALSKSMEFFLSTPHWLDALTPPLEKHLGHLAGTVQMLLSRIRKPEEGTEKAESVESGRAVGTITEKGPHRPPPVRKALEFGVVVRWGGRPIVRLAAVFLAVAAVVALSLFLVGWPFGGGEGAMVVVPTSTWPPPLSSARPTVVEPELGTWSGTTSQARSVEFDVIEGGAIGRIKIDVEGECPVPTPGVGPQLVGCTCSFNRETRMTKPWPIAATGFSYAPGDFEFSAVFDSSTTASGFVRVHTSGTTGVQAPCSSDQVTWTAALEQAGPASPGPPTSFVSPTARTPRPSPTAAPTSTPGEGSPVLERPPELLWRSEIWTPAVHTSPAVVSGVVYFGAHDQNVYALDAATGKERWRFQTSGLVYSSPAVVGGVLYIGSNDGYVYALDAANGAERWRFQAGSYILSSPVVVDGVVYIGSWDEYVYALDATTGEKRWRFKMGAQVSSLAVEERVLYVTSCEGLSALDAATGEEQWRVSGWGCISSAPVAVDGVVYIATSGDFRALDAATGGELWHFSPYLGGQSDPAVVAGVIYVGDREGYVYALDASTGEQRWRVETGEWVEAGLGTWRFEPGGERLSSPAVADGVVYIGSDDNCLYALEAATGEQLWRFETGFWVRSRPAVVDGVIYFGSVDGYVYALDATTGE